MSDKGFTLDYQKKELPIKAKYAGLAFTILGLIIVIVSYITNPERTAYNSIIGSSFVLSIGVASLFLIILTICPTFKYKYNDAGSESNIILI